jgi:hypothetical protein
LQCTPPSNRTGDFVRLSGNVVGSLQEGTIHFS